MTDELDEAARAVAEERGCCYGDCENKEVWTIMRGLETGQFTFLCEKHTKLMSTITTPAKRKEFAETIGFVLIVDLGPIAN